MKTKAIYFIIILYVFSLWSCEEVNDSNSIENNMSLICNLSATDSIQTAKIFRMAEINETDNRNEIDRYQITDGNIIISDETGSFPFKYSDKLKSFSDSGSMIGKLIPGRKYKIEASTSFGKINGETTVPEKFSITAPQNGSTIMVKKDSLYYIHLSWQKSNGAKIYLIEGTIPFKYNFNGKEEYHEVTGIYFTKDTFYVYNFSTANFLGVTPLKTIKYKITAKDQNYYDNVFMKKARSGIDNYYGCFSSSYSDSIIIKWEIE